MDIAFTGVSRRQEFWDKNTGYGKLSKQLFDVMQSNGHHASVDDKFAALAICAENPGWLYRNDQQYTIGHTTHESTGMVGQWINNISVVDEIWAPSEWVAQVFKEYYDKNITVVPIFAPEAFMPTRREKNDKFYFLHVGEPSPRKGGNMVLQAFQELFGDNPDVIMVFKSSGNTMNLPSIGKHENIILIVDNYSEQQMNKLYAKVHCMVYPSMGEGGGFIPLEAMLTGLPTISTTPWADYKQFIHLPIESMMIDVPDDIVKSTMLRGQIILPDIKSIKDQMLNVYENYHSYEKIYSDSVVSLQWQHSSDRIMQQIIVPRLEKVGLFDGI